jgi:predicted dehydrogenase
MSKLKLVVVGPGLIGKKHIELISRRPDAELVAIVAPDRDVNRALASHENVSFDASLRRCLESHSPDGVIIASPNTFHAQQARICIEHGAAVLIEKPITSSVQEGEQLVRLIAKKGARVAVGHHRAHSPIMSCAREIIRSQRLGNLVTVSGSAQFIKPRQYFVDGPWRTKIGGGPILINLIHEVGNLRALCGDIVEVQAMASSRVRRYPVEDTVVINLQFASGVLGTFILSDAAASARSWEHTTGENPAYPQYPEENCYLVAGTKGSLDIPTMRLRYFPNDIDPSWWTPFSEEVVPVERKDPLACQLENFLDVVRGRCKPLVSAIDGLQNLLVTEAIRLSALTRRSVPIDRLGLIEAGFPAEHASSALLNHHACL